MSLAAIIAEARACGLTLVADGLNLRVRGPSGALTADLRSRLQAMKTDLLPLLDLAAKRQREIGAAWAQAYGRLSKTAAEWPRNGFDTLRRLRPELMRRLAGAEREADKTAVAYHQGRAPDPDVFLQALSRWDAAVLQGSGALMSICHDCGRESSVALVDPKDGSRFCRGCVGHGERR